MAQTSYPTAPSIAIEGMLANLSPHTIESRTNSDQSERRKATTRTNGHGAWWCASTQTQPLIQRK